MGGHRKVLALYCNVSTVNTPGDLERAKYTVNVLEKIKCLCLAHSVRGIAHVSVDNIYTKVLETYTLGFLIYIYSRYDIILNIYGVHVQAMINYTVCAICSSASFYLPLSLSSRW